MTAVLCKCGRAHGVLEHKVLKLRMHHEKKPTRKVLMMPLTTLKNGKMVASCCSEPLCDMLGHPVLSRHVDAIKFTNIVDEEDA